LYDGELTPLQRRRLREQRRRTYFRRRMIALAIVLSFIAGIAAGAVLLSHRGSGGAGERASAVVHKRHHGGMLRQPRPKEIRGVHVTMALASLPGRLDRYFGLRSHGLNTIELDVKDESGQVAFHSKSVPLATKIGAAKSYYNPRTVATRAHARGIYLIGRVVMFEDPVLSEARPAYGIHNPDGSVWHNSIGLGWTNPYNHNVWRYDIGIAEAAAKAGFDEIEFDYVRFASDGDLSQIVYPGANHQPKGKTITSYIRFATSRLHPLGARVSADVFGLSAAHDLGIGQFPHQIGRYLDSVSPMVYPSHYTPGELGVPNPDGQPGPIVYRSLRLFNQKMRHEHAQVVPWLQSFSLGRTYGFEDVQAQIDAARLAHAGGFLLWNPNGDYMGRTLRPYSLGG
jgi:hypothetical protein